MQLVVSEFQSFTTYVGSLLLHGYESWSLFEDLQNRPAVCSSVVTKSTPQRMILHKCYMLLPCSLGMEWSWSGCGSCSHQYIFETFWQSVLHLPSCILSMVSPATCTDNLDNLLLIFGLNGLEIKKQTCTQNFDIKLMVGFHITQQLNHKHTYNSLY